MKKIPRQRRSVETVDRVIEAAARILEAGGLSALNTNAIAEVASVSPGSIYQYFEDKHSVVVALIEREARDFIEDGLKATKGLRGKEALIALVYALTQHRMRRPRLTLQLFLLDPSLLMRPESAAISEEISRIFLRIIEEDTRLRDADAMIFASDIVGISRGMLSNEFLNHRHGDDLPSRIADAVSGFWDARIVLAQPASNE